MILTYSIPSLQGTLAKRLRPTLQPNFAKEPFSPSRSDAITANPDKTKNSASMESKCLKMNKAQNTTRNIRKPGDVGNLSFCTFTQNCNGLTSWSLEIPASAYCHPME